MDLPGRIPVVHLMETAVVADSAIAVATEGPVVEATEEIALPEAMEETALEAMEDGKVGLGTSIPRFSSGRRGFTSRLHFILISFLFSLYHTYLHVLVCSSRGSTRPK